MGNENKVSTAERLKQLMALTGLRQIDVLKKIQPYCEKWNIKIGSNGLSQYITGKVEPRQKALSVFAEAFNVSPVWLMGYDVPMEIDNDETRFISIHEFREEVFELLNKVNDISDRDKKKILEDIEYFCGDDNNGRE